MQEIRAAPVVEVLSQKPGNRQPMRVPDDDVVRIDEPASRPLPALAALITCTVSPRSASNRAICWT
jgi:hypothetical protein